MNRTDPPSPDGPARSRPLGGSLLLAAALATLHGAGILAGMGGRAGVQSPWPMAAHDHPIQEHNAWLTRPILARTGLTAGYDPYFMSGYVKSLISSPSSTMFEVVALAIPGRMGPRAYKVTLFLAMAALPWLIMIAARGFGLSEGICAWSVALFVLFVWTDGAGGGYPLNYAGQGMTAYLLSIPLALVTMSAFVSFLRGGFLAWLATAILAAITFLVHVTSVVILLPAGIAAMIAAMRGGTKMGPTRFMGALLLPLIAALLNAFWWFPALVLRSTRLEERAFFANKEPVWNRLGEIVWSQSPSQAVLVALGLLGVVALGRRDRLAAAALGAFATAGFALGYLAGAFRSLDFMQPGRQTYAFYAAGTILAAVGLVDVGRAIGAHSGRGGRRLATLALLLVGLRIFAPYANAVARMRIVGLGGVTRPFLGSDPMPGYEKIVGWVKANVAPGERIFYEEAGIGQPGDPEPFQSGRYSGLLPQVAGVEVVGGFYLHAAVKTNFTQIGEGKLFGGAWTRERFRRYAAIYRPQALLCWSRQAKRFCVENADLVKVANQDEAVWSGRVEGFSGPAIRGKAEVIVEPGRLRVLGMAPDLDGLVVLRYHHAPGLFCTPPARLEPIFLEEDPVPFVGIRPGPGQTDALLDWSASPGR